MTNPHPVTPRFFAPEVVQTSAMDCGPAALKTLLEGFSIPVSYGRLREACQTDVDGTSIDTLEDVINQLGLEAEQVIAPPDHILLPEEPITPALIVVRQPAGLTHFVVLWRLHAGRWVQVMDPARGRVWMSRQEFLGKIYHHRMPFPADVWREWAASDSFCNPLRWRLNRLKLDHSLVDRLLTDSLDDPGWRSLAALDATTRLVASIVETKGLAVGNEAGGVLERLFDLARHSDPGPDTVVPPAYWLVAPLPNGQLLFEGAVLLQIYGRAAAHPETDEADSEAPAKDIDPETAPEPPAEPKEPEEAEVPEETETLPLSPELVAALAGKPERPEFELLRLLREDGLLSPLLLTAALCLSALGVMVEALLLAGLIEAGQNLQLNHQITMVVAALLALAGLLFGIKISITLLILRLGRRLESRWRIAFLSKIPRLNDQYFRSRLVSDMARRAHELHYLRQLPRLGFNFLQVSFHLFWIVVGIAWLDLGSAPLAFLTAGLAIVLPLLAQPVLAEQDQRLQAHAGGLSLFSLDALLGLMPIRAHSATLAMRREHESRLIDWARTNLNFYQSVTAIEALTALLNTGLAVSLILNFVFRGGNPQLILLLAYWSLMIVVLGKNLGTLARQYPRNRNRILRLLEPLHAPERTTPSDDSVSLPMEDMKEEMEPGPGKNVSSGEIGEGGGGGVSIIMKDVHVQAGGHTLLEQINLTLEAGEQVAIVGASGAGKSSLVGLLLGWYQPAGGTLLVDGQPLNGSHLQKLRNQTVWVDPAVQLWNRTFLQNLRYGADGQTVAGAVNGAIKRVNLTDLLKRLPHGMQTPLGEGGGLVSGGEGQRVRLGRGMLRPGVRLVILDESFRGLDGIQRQELLARTRQLWPQVTLLYITHDVAATQQFKRVLVVEAGRLVEDGSPTALAEQPGSRYRALLAGHQAVHAEQWAGPNWRRLWLEAGQLRETAQESSIVNKI